MSNPSDPNPYERPGEPNPYGQNPGASNPYGQGPGEPNPYGQGPGEPNPYQAANPYPQGGYGYAPQPHPQGTTVLVLGIVGLVVCFIAGIVGLVIGNRALKEIDANPAAYNNRQTVVIGRILSMIGIVLQVLGIAAYVIFAIVLVSQGAV